MKNFLFILIFIFPICLKGNSQSPLVVTDPSANIQLQMNNGIQRAIQGITMTQKGIMGESLEAAKKGTDFLDQTYKVIQQAYQTIQTFKQLPTLKNFLNSQRIIIQWVGKINQDVLVKNSKYLSSNVREKMRGIINSALKDVNSSLTEIGPALTSQNLSLEGRLKIVETANNYLNSAIGKINSIQYAVDYYKRKSEDQASSKRILSNLIIP